MTDVNLGDVVEVLDPLVSPTVYQLRLSVHFVVLPSVYLPRFSTPLFASMFFFSKDLVAMGCDHFSYLLK